MSDAASLVSMLMIGLLGAGHCLGMCGGISAALGMAVDGKRKLAVLLGYNLGRIFSYSLAGLLVGLLGYWGAEYLAAGPLLRITAATLLVLMGLYVADWWRLLTWLERAGALLWRRVQPLASRFLPVTTVSNALLAGMIWGWLPCGLVYSALAYAATAEEPLQGAAMMLSFGLGTAPAVLMGGVFSEALRRQLQRRSLKRLMGVALIMFGAWVFWGVLQHAGHLQPDHAHHHHSNYQPGN